MGTESIAKLWSKIKGLTVYCLYGSLVITQHKENIFSGVATQRKRKAQEGTFKSDDAKGPSGARSFGLYNARDFGRSVKD